MFIQFLLYWLLRVFENSIKRPVKLQLLPGDGAVRGQPRPVLLLLYSVFVETSFCWLTGQSDQKPSASSGKLALYWSGGDNFLRTRPPAYRDHVGPSWAARTPLGQSLILPIKISLTFPAGNRKIVSVIPNPYIYLTKYISLSFQVYRLLSLFSSPFTDWLCGVAKRRNCRINLTTKMSWRQYDPFQSITSSSKTSRPSLFASDYPPHIFILWFLP